MTIIDLETHRRRSRRARLEQSAAERSTEVHSEHGPPARDSGLAGSPHKGTYGVTPGTDSAPSTGIIRPPATQLAAPSAVDLNSPVDRQAGPPGNPLTSPMAGPLASPRGGHSRASTPQPCAETSGWLVEEFLAAYWGHTRDAYRRDLADFTAWCHQRRVDPLQVSRVAAASYLADLETRGLASATIARRLVTLRGYYGLAVEEGLLTASPVSRLTARRRGQPARPVRPLTRDELAAFLHRADQSRPRDAALAWLLAGTGIRISEACNATRADLHLLPRQQTNRPDPHHALAAHADTHTPRFGSDNTSTVDASSPPDQAARLRVFCKGGLVREVPLHPEVTRRVLALPPCEGLPQRPDQQPRQVDEALVARYLFATKNGRPLDRNNATRSLQRVARAAGLAGGFSPHVLRHTLVTLAREAGCAIEDVQDAVGHADARTTRGYDRSVLQAERHPSAVVLPTRQAHPSGEQGPATAPPTSRTVNGLR